MDSVFPKRISATTTKTAVMVVMKITVPSCIIVHYNVRQASVMNMVTSVTVTQNVRRAMMKWDVSLIGNVTEMNSDVNNLRNVLTRLGAVIHILTVSMEGKKYLIEFLCRT